MAPPPDPERFRQVFGNFVTGVAVITCHGADGPAGATTNAVCSVSLRPPLLLTCLDRSSRTLRAVAEARRFAVNVLRAEQEDLADVFASKRVPREKFEAVAHRVEEGVPVLDDALAWFACDLRDVHDGGDHVIVVGEVTHLDATEGEPLIFQRGRYMRLAGDVTPSPARAVRGMR
jgi:3-hydroxy-9,10-secoandrosta-1,3,5(10)-triene-9,17-dione monooxygenase reductase component